MALAELFDQFGDSGMLVGGSIDEGTFRRQADEAGRPDESLVTVESSGELLDPEALKLAAEGLRATNTHHHTTRFGEPHAA